MHGGPAPLKQMTAHFLAMNAYDIRTRIQDEGRVALEPLIHVHELTDGGLVLEDDNVRVTAALVDHPPVTPAFAFRFDAPDRSIVISGDTRPSENLIKLANGDVKGDYRSNVDRGRQQALRWEDRRW